MRWLQCIMLQPPPLRLCSRFYGGPGGETQVSPELILRAGTPTYWDFPRSQGLFLSPPSDPWRLFVCAKAAAQAVDEVEAQTCSCQSSQTALTRRLTKRCAEVDVCPGVNKERLRTYCRSCCTVTSCVSADPDANRSAGLRPVHVANHVCHKLAFELGRCRSNLFTASWDERLARNSLDKYQAAGDGLELT